MKIRTKQYWESLLRKESQKLDGIAHLIECQRPEADEEIAANMNYGISLVLKDISRRVRQASTYLEIDLPYDDKKKT